MKEIKQSFLCKDASFHLHFISNLFLRLIHFVAVVAVIVVIVGDLFLLIGLQVATRK